MHVLTGFNPLTTLTGREITVSYPGKNPLVYTTPKEKGDGSLSSYFYG